MTDIVILLDLNSITKQIDFDLEILCHQNKIVSFLFIVQIEPSRNLNSEITN